MIKSLKTHLRGNPCKQGGTMKLIKNANVYGRLVDIAVRDGRIAAIGSFDADGLDLQGKRQKSQRNCKKRE